MHKRFAARTHKEMHDVLLDPDASGMDPHYWMIRGDNEDRNITVWESGLVGSEYVKTYGHYHHGALDETYWVLFGRGIALLQKRKKEGTELLDDVIEEFRVVHINQGDTLFVPPYFGHCLVNTGPSFLVTADNNATAGEKNAAVAPEMNDYAPIKRMGGFLYYVIEKDGAPALVRNTRYRGVESEDLGGLPVVEI